MRVETPKPHPGPYRTMKVDAGIAGVFVAVAFMVLGFVSMPIAKVFLFGAVGIGISVAIVLAMIRKVRNTRPVDTKTLHIDDKAAPPKI